MIRHDDLVSTIVFARPFLELKSLPKRGFEDQRRPCAVSGCDEMQGYLFSKPLPRDELTALLEPNG